MREGLGLVVNNLLVLKILISLVKVELSKFLEEWGAIILLVN